MKEEASDPMLAGGGNQKSAKFLASVVYSRVTSTSSTFLNFISECFYFFISGGGGKERNCAPSLAVKLVLARGTYPNSWEKE